MELTIIRTWTNEYERFFQLKINNGSDHWDKVICRVGLPENKMHSNKFMGSDFQTHLAGDLLDHCEAILINTLIDNGYEVA